MKAELLDYVKTELSDYVKAELSDYVMYLSGHQCSHWMECIHSNVGIVLLDKGGLN